MKLNTSGTLNKNPCLQQSGLKKRKKKHQFISTGINFVGSLIFDSYSEFAICDKINSSERAALLYIVITVIRSDKNTSRLQPAVC